MNTPLLISDIRFVDPTGPGPSFPLATAPTIVGLLPTSGGPTPATMVPTIPPLIPGGNHPSMSISNIPTIQVSIPILESQLHSPPVIHRNYIPIGAGNVTSPSRSTLSSSLDFMASLNLLDLA